MDSETLMQCPYDKSHMIRPSRFPFHLVKCRENNKSIAKKLAVCPFNARHRVPKKELELHMETCENKCALEPLPAFNHEAEFKTESLSSWKSPPCEENWEDDTPNYTPTFVLHEYGNYTPYNAHETTSDCFSPSVAAKPSQGGYKNDGKPTVPKNNPWGTFPGGASNAPVNAPADQPKPGNPLKKEWASVAAKPSQGGYTNNVKPSVPKNNPWGTIPGGTSNAPVNAPADQPKPGNSVEKEWPSVAAKPSQGGYNNDGKPTVPKTHPWGNFRVKGGASNADQSKPGNSLENEWPRLENRPAKEKRQFK